MRGAGAGLIVAAALALAGCKSADTKSPDDRPFGATGIGKNKDVKGKDTKEAKDGSAAKDGKDSKGKELPPPWWVNEGDVPKSVGPTNPKDPGFDPKTAAQRALGGKVIDAYGQPARNVPVRFEEVGSTLPGSKTIRTDNDGQFFANGWEPGRTYDVSVEVNPPGGAPLSGRVQTKVPNVTLLITLRDDLPPAAGGGPFPPNPRPSDKSADKGDFIPPTGGSSPSGAGKAPLPPKRPGENWSSGGTTNPTNPPATIGTPKGTPPGGGLPEPSGVVPARPERPENVADGPKDPRRPPPANIPGPGGDLPDPALPPVPKLSPAPTGTPMSRAPGGAGANKITLLDAQERPWEVSAVGAGGLALLEFMTTDCPHCPRAVPILKDLQARYGAAGLQVVGVLCDDLSQKERARAAAEYARKYELNYAVYV
ncbi:MAG: redoxin domain-containing protein, partial [Gemmataceae bacterium]|nr:redoxin domain-containing protein [Gemmataceae bacterium]